MFYHSPINACRATRTAVSQLLDLSRTRHVDMATAPLRRGLPLPVYLRGKSGMCQKHLLATRHIPLPVLKSRCTVPPEKLVCICSGRLRKTQNSAVHIGHHEVGTERTNANMIASFQPFQRDRNQLRKTLHTSTY